MFEAGSYRFEGYLRQIDGSREAVTIVVTGPVPVASADGVFECRIETGLLRFNPYRVYSRIEHDALAAAFEVLNDAVRMKSAELIDAHGVSVKLPSPPRDRSWVPPLRIPDVSGLEPVFRVEGWASLPDKTRRRYELAIWPPVEERSDRYCAPLRCAPEGGGKVYCAYGSSAEQALYFAYYVMQAEAESAGITDDSGKPITIPLPPKPDQTD